MKGEFSLLADVSEAEAKTALQVVPRTRMEYGPQHRKIRRLEQLTAEQLLHEKRHVWVISDWAWQPVSSSPRSLLRLENTTI